MHFIKKINFFHNTIFSLFLLSGILKSIMKAFQINLPIDFTLLTWILLIICFSFVSLRNKFEVNKNLFISLVFFYLWILISSSYTSSDFYYILKVRNIILNITAVVVTLVFYNKNNIKSLFNSLIVISTFFNLIFVTLILPYIYLSDLFFSVRAQYLTVSYLSGINLIYLITANNVRLNLKCYLLIVLNLITLFGSGGRGGIIGFIVLTLLFFILNFKKISNIFSIRVLPVILLIFFLVLSNIEKIDTKFLEQNFERSFRRLEMLTKNNKGSSVNERIQMIDFSILEINNDILFGKGIGSFSKEYHKKDGRAYPHNLILEIWFELGIIGLSLFITFCFLILKGSLNNYFIWLILFVFFNAFKSSELGDLRIMFFILSCPKCYQILNKNEI